MLTPSSSKSRYEDVSYATLTCALQESSLALRESMIVPSAGRPGWPAEGWSHMGSVGLLYVGAVLFLSGMMLLGWVDGK